MIKKIAIYGINDAIAANADRTPAAIISGFFVPASSSSRAIPVLGFDDFKFDSVIQLSFSSV
jgi:hypothetical protein